MKPIYGYLDCNKLVKDKIEAEKITMKSMWFAFIREELYKKSYSDVWLKCVTP